MGSYAILIKYNNINMSQNILRGDVVLASLP